MPKKPKLHGLVVARKKCRVTHNNNKQTKTILQKTIYTEAEDPDLKTGSGRATLPDNSVYINRRVKNKG